MLDNIFEIIYLIGVIVGSVVRAVGMSWGKNWWRKKQKVADDRHTNLEKIVLSLVSIGFLILPLIYVFSSWLDFADYHLPALASLVSGWVGAAALAAAIGLLWRSHADLGQNFSPELKIRKEHALITHGVFRFIRHPMYTAHLLWGIAQALLLQNWIAGLAFLVSFLPFCLLRVPREEQMMLEHFGEEYRLYMDRTGQMIPRIKR